MAYKKQSDRKTRTLDIEAIRRHIRAIPDFPKPGVVFRDITPLLADAEGFRWATEQLATRINYHQPDAIVAIEARGFIFGSALALTLGLPLQLVRKPGKLPHRTIGMRYQLEYGDDTLEAHEDAFMAGGRYAIVDDLMATGGTAAAVAALVESRRAEVACCAFLIELSFLNGRKKLARYPVESLLVYEAE
ncbi:MAG: adenine phosphoribosyltransferase [Gammaproteobacteria bacterium]